MSQLIIPIPQPWHIRTPAVVRYLEAQYVDEFFTDGKLRLTSFATFRTYEDEQAGDPHDGRTYQEVMGPNHHGVVVATNGAANYVLCSSTVESDAMADLWRRDAGIRILDTFGFAQAVAQRIPGFLFGMEGPCTYVHDLTVIVRDDRTLVLPAEKDIEAWAARMDADVAERGKESFFRKRLLYSPQSEYRFVWIGTGAERPYLKVECPEARQYCQRWSR
jgi:hypothetical protein